MPIRRENKDRYPQDWGAISKAIRERACQRCEACSAENYKPHPVTGSKVVLTVAHLDHQPENCDQVIKVGLTVAHLDHQPENCDPANLRAWCQRCHNRYDAPMRRAGIKARAREALATPDMWAREGEG